jgi:hypothetical protein
LNPPIQATVNRYQICPSPDVDIDLDVSHEFLIIRAIVRVPELAGLFQAFKVLR